MAVGYLYGAKTPQNADLSDKTLNIVQGSALLSVSPVYIPQPVVYGAIIDNLNRCENYGRWDDKTIVDTNGKLSYGGLMFQLDTFLGYGKLSGVLPKSMTKEQALEVIYEKDLQTRIADYMIHIGVAPTPQGWYNCWKKQGL